MVLRAGTCRAAAGLGIRCSRKRIVRLMRADGLQDVCHRRKRGHKPVLATHDDLVKRQFRAEGSDRLWLTDIARRPVGSTAAR